MQRIVRFLGLGVVVMVVGHVAVGCAGQQVEVGPVAPGRATCMSVCQQMQSCPTKGVSCTDSCGAAQSLAAQAACEMSLQTTLDCLASQPSNICTATQNACHTQTVTLGACLANYCTKNRLDAPNQALCVQATVAF